MFGMTRNTTEVIGSSTYRSATKLKHSYHDCLLGRLEVSVDDLVEVEVVHASSHAHGPVDEQGGGDVPTRPQHLVQLALGTVLHQDTVTRGLGADTPEWRRAEREEREE